MVNCDYKDANGKEGMMKEAMNALVSILLCREHFPKLISR
jgi:hypothetical protein